MAKTKAELADEVAALRADLGIISSELEREADERSWCPAYAEFVDTVNSQTSEPHLNGCVTRTVEGTVTIAFSELTVTTDSDQSVEDAIIAWFTQSVINTDYALDRAFNVELGG